jgi:hypothetical protein
MTVRDVLNDLPADLFPAAVEGRCSARMHGKERYDLCALKEGHAGKCVSYATKRRLVEKHNPERDEKRIALMREIAAEFGYKITPQSAEAKARISSR